MSSTGLQASIQQLWPRSAGSTVEEIRNACYTDLLKSIESDEAAVLRGEYGSDFSQCEICAYYKGALDALLAFLRWLPLSKQQRCLLAERIERADATLEENSSIRLDETSYE